MTVFIYGLYCPRDGALRYVGKTNDLKHRLTGHLRDRRHTHRRHWIDELKRAGMTPEMRVLETIEDSNDLDWQERERWWIQAARECGDPVTNLDSGGVNGMKKSPETCERIGAVNRGRKRSDETRARIVAANQGRVRSLEARQKTSASLRRHYDNPEACARNSRVQSQETRDRRSRALTAYWSDHSKREEQRIRITKAKRNRKKLTPSD